MANLVAIKYQRGSLKLLDQRLLPFQQVWLDVPDTKAAWQQIKDMVVRGAPAIGVTGALSLAVELNNHKGLGAKFETIDQAITYVDDTLDYLVTSRPTAVNLADAADKLKRVAKSSSEAQGATTQSVVASVVEAAELMIEEDVRANRDMGKYGAAALIAAVEARKKLPADGKVRVLTICNTGSLATAGYGTALGIIRALHEQGKLQHTYACETRPYNQGARLTAFEMVHDHLPATLICDSAAAALMASGQVDAVVTGADRVVANGDSANKIGTYMLSIICAHHNIPFFIAAPTTTLDPNMADGSAIVIEQRPSDEVTHFKGERVVVEGINIWNPSFDVAPATLIEGIITEKGPIPRDAASGSFRVQEFMAELGLWFPSKKQKTEA